MTIYEELDQTCERIDALKKALSEEQDRLLKLMSLRIKLEKTAAFVMNTQAPLQAPALVVLPSPTETPLNAPSSDLGRVRVDWSGRGHSSGSYAVKAEDELSFTIVNGTDENKPTMLRISKARCEKVTVVVEKVA